MSEEEYIFPPPDLFAEVWEHIRKAHNADEESRRNGERRRLFFREPDPDDFLGENEDGSLSYRPRSHDQAHIALDEGLAGLHGLLGRWTQGTVTLQEGKLEAARLRDWVAKAEAAVWATYDPQQWPQIALALREIRLAAEAWVEV